MAATDFFLRLFKIFVNGKCSCNQTLILKNVFHSTVECLKIVINPFQPSILFHIETSHLFVSNDWFLCEMQHWAKMG